MENKNSGIFLGVISIATLIVAIIGATFAWFSATASSTNNAIDTKAYEFSMGITVEKVLPADVTEKGLIPLKATDPLSTTNTTQHVLHAINNKNCIDDKGYQVCQLYRVTITNSTENQENLTLKVKTTKNEAAGQDREAFKDLTLQFLEGNAPNYGSFGNSLTLPDTVGTDAPVYGSGSGTQNPTAMQFAVPAHASNSGQLVRYFVVYLNETNADQSKQMGASYEGQLIFSTGDNANHLTGTFTAGV